MTGKKRIIKFTPSFRQSCREDLGLSEEETRQIELDVIKHQAKLREGVDVIAGEKLVCDRCGAEYTDTESVEEAKRYQEKWAELCREDGVEPRGLTACPNIQCTGELQLKEV